MTTRRELLDMYDGVKEWFVYDYATGNTHIEMQEDVEPLLDQNRLLSNDDAYTQSGMNQEMWHYASIPVVVQMQWLKEYGREQWPLRQGNETLLYRLLNSPEWKYLKTTTKFHTSTS